MPDQPSLWYPGTDESEYEFNFYLEHHGNPDVLAWMANRPQDDPRDESADGRRRQADVLQELHDQRQRQGAYDFLVWCLLVRKLLARVEEQALRDLGYVFEEEANVSPQ